MPAHNKAPQRWARLSGMSWEELWTRCRQELGKRWDVALHRAGIHHPTPVLASTPARPAHFFFAATELAEILGLLQERRPHETQLIVQRADRICRHRFDLLGYQDLDYGAEINWHLDAAHGKRAPRKPWYQINYLDFDEVGDSKVTWELNRHQHMVTLAKAAGLTQDNRYSAELLRQWYHWQQENPYPIGINWASSLEVALRSLSWLWVLHLLASSSPVSERFPLDLMQALAQNGGHIERYLSTYFSPNTHLLGEATALFFLGTLCPQLPAARRWQQRGWEIILQQAQRQVQPDGMHFEQSTYYHVYALDFLLHARILAAANQMSIPAAFDHTLERMLEILSALGQAGAPPRFGDDDGGRVFDPHRNRAEHLLDPLSTGAVLFRRTDFKAIANNWREETLWLLGPDGVAEFDQLPVTPPARASLGFESSGIYVMASSEPVPRQLVIDAGPQGAGKAGHGHADALGLHLVLDGQEALVDPGTYVYVSNGAERDLFRSTAAHNTLEVDGLSQAETTGPFSWRSLPAVRVDHWLAGKTFDLFAASASHTGYRRLPDSVVHHRWVFHLKSRFWLVRDLVVGEGVHQLDLFWHLAPGTVVRTLTNATVRSGANSPALALLPVEAHAWSQQTSQGWRSPAYGSKEPSPVLHFGTQAQLPVEFATLLLPVREASEELGVLTRVEEKAKNPSVHGYRYANSVGCHAMFFAEPGLRWELGRWASDAQFLYCGTTPEGGLRHLVLYRGSHVEIDGQQVLTWNRQVMRGEWLGAATTGQLFCSEEAPPSCLPGHAFATPEPDLAGEQAQSPRGGTS